MNYSLNMILDISGSDSEEKFSYRARALGLAGILQLCKHPCDAILHGRLEKLFEDHAA